MRPRTVPETIRLSLVTTTSPSAQAWSGKIRGNGSTSRPHSIRAPPRRPYPTASAIMATARWGPVMIRRMSP